MNRSFIALITFLTVASGHAFAASKEISVIVKGMVCGFCAQGIEKKFKAEPSVERVKVSLAEKRVTLHLKDGKELSDERIAQILNDAGYTVDKVESK